MPEAGDRGPFTSDVPALRPKNAAMLQQELQICDERIAAGEKSARWHGIFALLGASPAALLPMVGIGIDFGPMAVLAASACVVGIEAWRYRRAQAEVEDAMEERARLLEAADQNPGAP